MVKVQKNDFVEIEFVGKTSDGEVFDTNIKEEADKAGLQIKEVKPYVLCVGKEMILPGLDEDLEGKEIGGKFSVEILPEKGFGKRNPQLVRMFPESEFRKQNLRPERGMSLNLGGQLVRVVSVSGGRVLLDFNNPLAGKNLIYDYKVNKKVEELGEKISALQDVFFRKRFDFEVDEKKKELKLKIPAGFEKVVKIFEEQFKDILGLGVLTEVVADKKETSQTSPSS